MIGTARTALIAAGAAAGHVDETHHQAPAVLSEPRAGSTAGLHQLDAPTQTGARRVMLAAPAQWFCGVVNPRCLHLLETEDGRPRTLDIDGHVVGVAVCRTWLPGEAVNLDAMADSDVTVCTARHAVARELRHRSGAR